MRKLVKQERAVTLVALVVTIVILIILAVISLTIVFKEGGMINQAEKAKEHQANAEAEDNERMQVMDNAIKEYMAGKIENGYVDSELISSPKISDGMIPVKWNGTGWEKTTVKDKEWYNYGKKEWANIVLSDSTFKEDILDETKPYSQFVWIPRYAYKITSGWHSNTTGTIDVVFVGTDNKGKDGVTYNGSYSDAVAGVVSGGAMKNFVVEPAFDYDSKKLEGFWIGKFENSKQQNGQIQIQANVEGWTGLIISDRYTKCLNMNQENNSYGLNSNDNIVDPHLIKNTEWGSVAYLSKSKYGKETEEVKINITTTCGYKYKTTEGQKSSTTGNVYGIYDMNGCRWEETAAYVDNGRSNLQTYGKSLVEGKEKYREVYEQGTSDSEQSNYEKAAVKYGDAIYETSESGYTKSWYDDRTIFPRGSDQFFCRGGGSSYGSESGVFSLSWGYGDTNRLFGFRVTLPIL